MKMKTLVLCTIVSLAAFAFGQDANAPDSNPQDLSILTAQPESPMLGLHWARGFTPAARTARVRSNVNMTYHGGPIMTSTVHQAIYWGPSWDNSTFVGDKISGLDSWYTGFSNSNYAKTSDEYTGSNGQVGPVVTHKGHFIDTTTAANGS